VLKLLTGSVERSSRIINHLRQFGRKSDDTMSKVDVNDPIRSVFTIMGTQLKNTGIECKVELDENLPPIKGDANRLEQVFINLVLNARDALLKAGKNAGGLEELPRPKVVTIRSFLEANKVVVTVSDTGPGIPEELKSRVFEPFFTTKDRGEGTGLGLSISYRIIRDHRGTVELDNAETGGAVFRVTIPALATEKDHGETAGN
jgi:C4-dicarboxylate-specific signal transduction histidine kinase